jgi:hypothetical protein
LLLPGASAVAYAPEQIPVVGDTLKNQAKDSLKVVKGDTIKPKSDLKSPINYKATQYMLLDVKGKLLFLNDGGELTYEQMKLLADSVVVDWNTSTVSATSRTDSSGKRVGKPQFEDNGQKYDAEDMTYNFKSQKGLVEGAKTKQGEEYVLAEVVKKANDETYYIQNGKFTSCELDHPHYYIRSKRLKVIPGKQIITGPVQLVIEDLPLPLILPFGFFPNQTGKKSGIIMPQYGEAADRGFFLRNGGYYFAINEYVDFLLAGDIFSKGGWRLEGKTNYNKRYQYNGAFSLSYGVQEFGEPADGSLYRKESNFWVTWQHKQNIDPQTTLNASVNAGSTNYLAQNSYDEQQYLSNTLKSSVTFNHAFPNSGWRINATLDHTQNNRNKEVSMGLPTVALTRARFFPLKGRNSVGNKWYHKVGASYSMNLKNQITAPDSLIPQLLLNPGGNLTMVEINEGIGGKDTVTTTQRGLDFFRNGVMHTVPISTQFNLLQYINIAPTFNYRERWYFKERQKTWDLDSNKVDLNDTYGFFTARDFDFNLNASTRLYGIFDLKSKKGTMVRHTFLPAVGYRYRPDFSNPGWNVYRTVQTDTAGTLTPYSRFENSLFGSPSAGAEQAMTFSIGNVLEMKYRNKAAEKDTTIKDPWTRLTLLDNFSLSSSYNFAADSLNLQPVAMSARTNFLNNKLTLNWNGTLDPYAVNAQGRRIDTYRMDLNGRIGRLSNMSLALGTRLTSKNKKGQDPAETDSQLARNPNQDLRFFRDLYVDFEVPWTFNVNYILNYTNSGIRKDTTMTLNFSGDFNLSPKWKFGYTSGYDFSNKDFSYTSVTIYRDLHCWEMSMTWVPFGIRKSYNVSLNVKSSTLKDLKLTKRRDWQDQF